MRAIKLDLQFFLVKFPIIFPLVYGFILYNFPQFETELIIITILLLAETHFGATWPFLVDKANYPFIKSNRVSLVTLPVVIIILSLLGFFLIKELFLLIFFAANMYHVTRQSFGVGKLYCNDDKEKRYQELLIYVINFIFFIVGFFRFYFPIINETNFIYLNISVIFLLLSFFVYYIVKFGFSENFLIFVTGCLIFYPICFVENPVHAIVMGVTMHYTQYLYYTYNVCKMRNANNQVSEKVFFSKKIYNYLAIIIFYSIIMSVLSLLGKYDEAYLKNLIIIPIIGQMLHFYLDSQLWKFSEKHNRDNTLMYLKKLILG
tara:strand:- start:984 stop:1937 length:954 start_codon:yes stop_codon:yes gene_type:complete